MIVNFYHILKSKYFLFFKYSFYHLIGNHFPGLLSDKISAKTQYFLSMEEELDLKNPTSFTAKIQWLKLYDHNLLYTSLVDKYTVKQFVAGLIGDKYIIPTLGVWEKFEDIDFNQLPQQFVLKSTHDSASVIIVKDKSKFDKDAARRKLSRSLHKNFYLASREWPYKNVPRRIIAEQLMHDDSSSGSDLDDYKWYCFNGEPKFCQVIKNRNTDETIDFFDINWTHQDFIGLNPKARFSEISIYKPELLDSMI